jgi:hypothetical protein
MGKVTFESHIKEWSDKTEAKLDLAVAHIATDIHRIATMNAPVDHGTLVKSGRINREGQAHYKVIFGGGSVKYALRRHYENKKNPQTLQYLKRAGDSISNNIKRYLKGII